MSLSNTIDSGTWVTVNYTKTYVNPVVVAGPISHNNGLTLFARVRNVSASGFQIGMQSPCESAGVFVGTGTCPPASGWLSEEVNYWVMEEGAWEFPDGQEIEAGINFTSAIRSRTGPNSIDQVNLLHTYSNSTVAIYHSVMSFNDSSFIHSTASRDDSVGNPPTPTAADNDFGLMLEGM